MGHRANHLDGRAAASARVRAAHRHGIFRPDKWEGDILTVTTTHLKEGWIRRNGVTRSDRAVVTEYLHPARRPSNVGHADPRSGLSHRDRSSARATMCISRAGNIPPYPCESVVEIVRPERHHPASSARHQYVPEGISGSARHPGTKARWAGPKPCIPSTGRGLRAYPSRPRRINRTRPKKYEKYHDKKRDALSRRLSQRMLEHPCAIAQQNGEVHVCPCRATSYMLVGAGGNITVQIGKDGVLAGGQRPRATWRIRRWRPFARSPKAPIRYMINTHYHPDHTGGNEAIAQGRGDHHRRQCGGRSGRGGAEGAQMIAHENVLNRMSAPTGNAAADSARRLAHRNLF